VTVRAELAGHDLDLAALARHFPTGDPRIVVDDGHTYLEATALDARYGDGGALVATGGDILARLNGHAMLDDAGYRPVRLLNRFVHGNTMHAVVSDEFHFREHVVVVAGVAEARLGSLAAAAVVDGEAPVAPAPQGPDQLARAAANSDADELLALIGNAGALGWDVLWKAYEIIRAAVGGTKALIHTGWVTQDDLDNFGYAANQPSASGPDARHARRLPPKRLPTHILPIEEGQQFIRDLARQWLDSLP
jgi:hypothetical protein